MVVDADKTISTNETKTDEPAAAVEPSTDAPPQPPTTTTTAAAAPAAPVVVTNTTNNLTATSSDGQFDYQFTLLTNPNYVDPANRTDDDDKYMLQTGKRCFFRTISTEKIEVALNCRRERYRPAGKTARQKLAPFSRYSSIKLAVLV